MLARQTGAPGIAAGGRGYMRAFLRSSTLLIVVAFVVGACGGSTPAASAPPASQAPAATAAETAAGAYDEAAATKALYDAAVAAGETEVNLYSSINEEEAKPLLDIWAKSFPKIKANYIRGTEAQLVSRILTEAQAGKSNFDVTASTNTHLLVAAGLLLKYFPPNAAKLSEDVKSKDGMWFSIYTNWDVVQYNTNKVKKGDIKTYEDFLKPQFKGQIVIDNSDIEWYQGLINSMGQQKADDLIKNIVKTNGVTVVDGHGAINDKITAGEFAVALTQYVNQPERSKRQGGPTDWVAIEPVTVITAGKAGIDAKAPHPNAAKLMANFLISTDGQKYLASRGRQITRTDVPLDPPDLLKGISKTYVAPILDPAATAEITKKFQALFK